MNVDSRACYDYEFALWESDGMGGQDGNTLRMKAFWRIVIITRGAILVHGI